MLKFLLLSFIVTASSAWGFYPVDEKSQALFESLKGKEKETEAFFREQLKSANEYASENIEIRLTNVPKVEGQPISEWVPVLDPNTRKLVIDLRITEDAIKSPLVMAEEILRLNQITSGSFTHPYEWAETVSNAKAGSIRATEKLARMDVENGKELKSWLEANMSFFPEGTDPKKIEEWALARSSEFQKRYDPIVKAARVEQKRLEAEWEKKKPTFTELEKQDVKFNNLVMANDRAGVRKMLDTYLPWVLMEPSEQNAWKRWLDAMEKPNMANRQLVFRGMDNYPILKSPGSEKVGVFSSLLAMNQGNYTRRLRSLQTSREKVGRLENYNTEPDSKFPKDTPSVIDQMKSHAGNPVASPFISVSDNRIATRFGSQERMAILIDENRLVPNAMAFGYGEIERLIPLVIFPDEVVHYQGKIKGDEYSFVNDEEFIAKVSEAIGRPVTPAELNAGVDETEFIMRGFDRLKVDLLDPEGASLKGGPVCTLGHSCNCIRTALDKLLAQP